LIVHEITRASAIWRSSACCAVPDGGASSSLSIVRQRDTDVGAGMAVDVQKPHQMAALIDTQAGKLRPQLLGAMMRGEAGKAAPQRLHFRRAVEPDVNGPRNLPSFGLAKFPTLAGW
jgi:hypothetical protein